MFSALLTILWLLKYLIKLHLYNYNILDLMWKYYVFHFSFKLLKSLLKGKYKLLCYVFFQVLLLNKNILKQFNSSINVYLKKNLSSFYIHYCIVIIIITVITNNKNRRKQNVYYFLSLLFIMYLLHIYSNILISIIHTIHKLSLFFYHI